GASLRVDQRGVTLYQRSFGTYTPGTVVPIASATKWLSAAVVMSLVDEGRLRLDDRVAQYIPSFTGPKAAITIRQCFTHTSGLPDNDASISDDTITLRQAADRIALLP